MKLELKAVSVWTAVKIGFFLNLIMGFIMGLVAALFMAPLMAVMSTMMPAGAGGSEFAAMPVGLLLVILPIGYAIFGAVFGTITFAIGAGVYNVTARILGGLEITYTVVEWGDPSGAAQAPPPFPRYPAPAPPYPAYPPPTGRPGPYSGSPMPPPPPPPEARPEPQAPHRPLPEAPPPGGPPEEPEKPTQP
ncbi:MAG TPA: hypothetical protein PLR32_03100 [candidate division Zixibacteria bacterium]|nr:DUF3566 domain-containing protein [candidate division Zixibacteria bacterium]MDD4918539.1 hypothetical protein [candidate division Zixibacteria bacterium]HOD65599.1 hypothetical protein [candidate division Zixibacteria bacterium]HOZ06870.1 hypothetical protein [candidate division Zixibacteria bacterium]HPC11519.1 hypothetical protein [candidate division Zixibacteria bacterium]